jgi:hypothetical protein
MWGPDRSGDQMWLMSDTTAKILILLALVLGLLAILTGREDYSLRRSIAMLGPAVAAVDGPSSGPFIPKLVQNLILERHAFRIIFDKPPFHCVRKADLE